MNCSKEILIGRVLLFDQVNQILKQDYQGCEIFYNTGFNSDLYDYYILVRSIKNDRGMLKVKVDVIHKEGVLLEFKNLLNNRYGNE